MLQRYCKADVNNSDGEDNDVDDDSGNDNDVGSYNIDGNDHDMMMMMMIKRTRLPRSRRSS